MTIAQKTSRCWLLTLLGWFVACSFFSPIFWMFLTSFKTEVAAVATPPQLFFQPTLENYVAIQDRANYFNYALTRIHY
jgi:sorbitol/mannitol transport system permease protein